MNIVDDMVSGIGMFEHVGLGNLPVYFRRHVFSDGELDVVSNIQRGMGRARFEIADIEALRPHKAANGGVAATTPRRPRKCI